VLLPFILREDTSKDSVVRMESFKATYNEVLKAIDQEIESQYSHSKPQEATKDDSNNATVPENENSSTNGDVKDDTETAEETVQPSSPHTAIAEDGAWERMMMPVMYQPITLQEWAKRCVRQCYTILQQQELSQDSSAVSADKIQQQEPAPAVEPVWTADNDMMYRLYSIYSSVVYGHDLSYKRAYMTNKPEIGLGYIIEFFSILPAVLYSYISKVAIGLQQLPRSLVRHS